MTTIVHTHKCEIQILNNNRIECFLYPWFMNCFLYPLFTYVTVILVWYMWFIFHFMRYFFVLLSMQAKKYIFGHPFQMKMRHLSIILKIEWFTAIGDDSFQNQIPLTSFTLGSSIACITSTSKAGYTISTTAHSRTCDAYTVINI